MPMQTWVTLVIGVLGFSSVVTGILQKTHSDRRAEWWRRAAWAVDHTLSSDERTRIIGYDTLGRLQSLRPATAADRRLFAGWAGAAMDAGDGGVAGG